MSHSCVPFSRTEPLLGKGVLVPTRDGQCHIQRDSDPSCDCRLYTAVSTNSPFPSGSAWEMLPAQPTTDGPGCKRGQGLSPPASARPLPAFPRPRRRGHFENTHHLFDVGLQSQKAVMATANVSICFFSIDPCAVCR